ncbi:MAG: DUF4080 domain-containing protein [Candidatus Izemoplasmatales bacterium]
MKTILVSIDAKYIHTNLAVRYLKANTTYEADILEFTIKDSLSDILKQIISTRPDIIAFSCYIWNIEIVKKLLRELCIKKEAILILGGPEVSYENDFFFEENLVDYIIEGEGEIAFHKLLHHIHTDGNYVIPGLKYKNADGQIIHHPKEDIKDLNALKTPYHFEADILHIKNKIQYIETSRGCPFECSYCLASLENGVRYFDIERVKSEILYLKSHGAKTFKFLDRTFNIYPKYATEIFAFIFSIYEEGLSFQFEITGDILRQEIIEYVNSHGPKNGIRFEIGIQSTHALTNLAVNRKQNNKVLFSNIKKIIEGNIVDLHLDLIAGLPYETLPIFKKTFQEVFTLYAKELQLGFLKMLKGTLLKAESEKYHYIYHQHAPYEMIQNDYLSVNEQLIIHQVEEILELYWNKGFMNESITYLTKNIESVFDLFYQIYHYLINKQFDFHRYQLYEVFHLLDQFVYEQYPHLYEEMTYLLKKDYLSHNKIKPKLWWDKSIPNRTELYENIAQNLNIRLDDLYKYGILIKHQKNYTIFLFYPSEVITYDIKIKA